MKLLLPLMVLLSLTLMVSTHTAIGQQQIEEDAWFSAVVVLDDQRVQTLRSVGSLQVSIPPHLVNHIDAVVLRRPVFFKDEPATQFADFERLGPVITTGVDETLLNQLDYQSVELRVFESGFNSIVLRYAGGNAQDLNKLPLQNESDSPVFKVLLESGKGIIGRIKGIKTMDVNSVLGEVEIDLDRVTLIEVGKAGMTFTMRNGDKVTGDSELKEVELLTRWGNEVLDIYDIKSLAIQQSPIAAPLQPSPSALPTSNLPTQTNPLWTQPIPQYPMMNLGSGPGR